MNELNVGDPATLVLVALCVLFYDRVLVYALEFAAVRDVYSLKVLIYLLILLQAVHAGHVVVGLMVIGCARYAYNAIAE
jgi:hypothetical protein